jgi:hypothetical protein
MVKMEAAANWCLVSFPSQNGVGSGKMISKKGLKGAATGIGFATPFVFFLVMCFFYIFLIFASPMCMH